MRFPFRHFTLIVATALFLGGVSYIGLDRYFDESENSSSALRALSHLVEAMNRKDEPALHAMLDEIIVIKDVSGATTTEWFLSRHDLVTRVTQREIQSIVARNPRVFQSGERVDVQVFVQSTFNSEIGEIYHGADQVFTFVRADEHWKVVEITRDVSPVSFWQIIRNAPDVLIWKMLGISE